MLGQCFHHVTPALVRGSSLMHSLSFPTKLPILIPKANPTEPARPGAPDFPDEAGAGASKSDGLSPSSGDPLPGDAPFGLSASGGDARASAVGDGNAGS
ncbi:hypothetical protein SLA2020_271030 [Shorea laevis]